MKKKGLIVATIVMVLVLAVSLTTATYAWFSATASATIDSVTLTAAAADGLLIGAKSSTSQTDYTGYNYGEVTWDDNSKVWSGSSYMGTNLTFLMPSIDETTGDPTTIPMAIGTSKAVSYSSTDITGCGQSGDVTVPAGWFAANGTTATEYDKKTAEEAVAQVNYVDFDLAVTASKANNVKQAYLTLLVRPSTAQLKMAAAIHFFIQVGETVYTDTIANHGVSAYTGKVQTNNFSDSCTKGTYVSSANGKTADAKHDTSIGDWYFVVPLYNNNTAMTPYTDLVKIKLMMWIEGTDDACVIANAGTGGTVFAYFDYEDTVKYTFGMTTGDTPTQTSGANYNGLMASI